MDFSDVLYYSEDSPSGLRWKLKTASKILVDGVAGSRGENRWIVRIESTAYLAHRIVYELHYGCIPEDYDIDHIDRNPLNNRIENLRAVPHSVNMRNTKLQKNNKSGKTGVNYKEIYDPRTDYLYKGWRAEWRSLEGKNCTKLFSTRRYGYEEAFKLACEYRKKMIEELNQRGANYSETHGE